MEIRSFFCLKPRAEVRTLGEEFEREFLGRRKYAGGLAQNFIRRIFKKFCAKKGRMETILSFLQRL